MNKEENKKSRKIYVVGGSVGYANWMEGEITRNPEEADLILFTGGEDINPRLYNEKPGRYTHFSERDNREVAIYEAFVSKIPMWGTCRGLQILTALNGGKLIQDVNSHASGNHDMWVGYHPKSEKFGDLYDTTSCHHQMCYPFDLPKEDYVIIAHSLYPLSDTYTNGDNEEIKLPNDFVEPEIIYYPKTMCLGIQGHPEFSSMPEETNDYLRDLLDEFLDGSLKERCKISSNVEINENV